MQIISKTLEDTRKFAKDLIELLTKQEFNRATILNLEGNLGAGKTTLVQMIGQELGVKETIQSPTFVLMKSYKTKHIKFKNLVHIDAYRIEHTEETKILNLEEIFSNKDNLVCIEWAEKIRGVVPGDSVKVVCELLEGDEHGYEIQC
jgi:tRNA threonylcarbamoyladenosine biosynthesis protein TsaE